MGPKCPECGNHVEWTVGEVIEDVCAPKVYICEKCREMWTVDIDEVQSLQEDARRCMGLENSSTSSETPEDWAKLREAWDSGINPDDIEDNDPGYPW